jgi:hypothetical protein
LPISPNARRNRNDDEDCDEKAGIGISFSHRFISRGFPRESRG